jgi:hypothetical protein
MLRRLLLIAVLLAFFAQAAMAGGGFVEEIPQMTQHIVTDDDGMSPEVLAALILGGLGLTGAIITALVNGRRRKG